MGALGGYIRFTAHVYYCCDWRSHVVRVAQVTPYEIGVEAERELVNDLREMGWLASRTAGSHGPVDVVALKRGKKRDKVARIVVLADVKCYQVGKKMPPVAWDELFREVAE